MRILVSYRGIPQSPGWATGDMVVRAFRALGHEVDIHAKYYQEERWVEDNPVHEGDYDLLLYMECNDPDRQYLELRNVRATKTACWLFDTSYYPDHLTRLAALFNFDHHFIANPVELQYFPDATYLPYACDPSIHFRQSDTPKNYDVALVGSVREDRKKLQKNLRRAGIEMELIGGVFREEYIDALASARIIINQNPDAGIGLLNMRYWEAPCAGAALLTEERDLAANFQAGLQNVVHASYNDVDSIVSQCRSILDGDMGDLSGQSKVLQYHTYEARCRQILETVFPYATN